MASATTGSLLTLRPAARAAIAPVTEPAMMSAESSWRRSWRLPATRRGLGGDERLSEDVRGDAQTSSWICRCRIRAQDRVLAWARPSCPGFLSINPRVSGLIPHRHPDCRTDGVLGHESASVGLRLSPPRPVARARAFFGALVPNPTWAGDGVAGLSGRWVLPGTGRSRRVDARARRSSVRITLARRAVRRLEFRSCTGFRSARWAGGLDARLGASGRTRRRARWRSSIGHFCTRWFSC